MAQAGFRSSRGYVDASGSLVSAKTGYNYSDALAQFSAARGREAVSSEYDAIMDMWDRSSYAQFADWVVRNFPANPPSVVGSSGIPVAYVVVVVAVIAYAFRDKLKRLAKNVVS